MIRGAFAAALAPLRTTGEGIVLTARRGLPIGPDVRAPLRTLSPAELEALELP